MTALHELPAAERPRERLLTQGAAALADAELLAVLLGRGRAGADVLECARRLLARAGSLEALDGAGVGELAAASGVGLVGALRVRAALELGRRAVARPPAYGERIGSPLDLARALRVHLLGARCEHLLVVGLDARSRSVGAFTVAVGGLAEVTFRPRELLGPLLREPAVAMVVAHNHPSGDPEPSAEDVALTRRLEQLCALFELPLLDHVVVARGGVVSLAERGLVGRAGARASPRRSRRPRAGGMLDR